MTPLRSRSGRLTALIASLLLLPAVATAQSDLRESFDQGVSLLRSGDREAALAQFQAVLAMDPSHEAAYELWKSTSHDVWLDLLAESGRFELIGKRLMDLASAGREERRDDPEAVSALLDDVFSDDAVARRKAILTLSSQHGEYVVPVLVPILADQVDGDRRVLAIHTLTEMGSGVVLPLIQTLKSEDAFLRRQVAYTLGYIGDSRAVPALAATASSDGDSGVAKAAASALSRIGGNQDAVAGYLMQGDLYRAEDPKVLGPGMRSSVVWSWNRSLEKAATPSYLYADKLAESAYYEALLTAPNNLAARVGIAGAAAAQAGALETRAAAGVDVDEQQTSVAGSLMAASAVGSDALDMALGHSLDISDETGAAILCRLLGNTGNDRTGSLQRALGARGAVASEAALALGHIALRTGAAVETDAVEGLARSAGREIMQVAGVIDDNEQRVNVLRNELEGRGVLVRAWSSAAVGLAAVRRSPGFDVLIITDRPSDLTAHQVFGDLREDPRMANTQLLVVADDADEASELYGDWTSGVLTTSDLSALDDALAGEMTGDRARAKELAVRSAKLLAALSASSGAELMKTQARLAAALSGSEEVLVPLLTALGRCGDGTVVEAVTAVLTDSDHSEEARVAAADALTGIFTRTGSAGADTTAAILETARNADSAKIRMAAATTLGRLELDAETRAGILNGLRSTASE